MKISPGGITWIQEFKDSFGGGWDQILRVQRGGDKALKYKLDVKGQITEML